MDGLRQAHIEMPMRLFASSKVLGRLSGMELDAVDPGQFLYADATIIRSLTSVLTQVRAVTRDFAEEHAPFDVAAVRRVGVIPFGKVGGKIVSSRSKLREYLEKLIVLFTICSPLPSQLSWLDLLRCLSALRL